MKGLAKGLLVLGIILIIGMIGSNSDSSADTCIRSGCSNKRASGSSYCYIHKPYTGSTTHSSGYSSSSYSTGTGNRTTTSTATSRSTTSSYSGGSSSLKTNPTTERTYNYLNNDPEDYDDPEEYADDAWGDDFDDWDEAYDYWEDY
jgi:hypothetical protein